MKEKIELLAPAGSLETCKAVILTGADAVYLGGNRFGARAYAENFTEEELKEAIDFAHLHGAKIHLTVNTLFKQQELEELYDYILPFYENGLDAVIVQDFGVLQFLRTCFPDLDLHASTQMSVTSEFGAGYLYENGVSRIVLARELSLDEIERIHGQVPVELEVFVHGALCYSYSGRCLMSSMLGGRSGNRGRCAGTCRLPYGVMDDGHRQILDGRQYPLSLKDLCAIGHLSKLADAGVFSFKIEGRMKSTEYAAGVVSVYRRYFDDYLNGQDILVQEDDRRRLADAGNRSGFTDGYSFRRNGRKMVSFQKPGHEKNESGLKDYTFHAVEANAKKMALQGKVELKVGEPSSLILRYGGVVGQAGGGVVQAAQNSPMEADKVWEQLSKLGNTPFCLEEDGLEIVMDAPVFLPKQQLNQLRRDAVEDLTRKLLAPARRQPEVSKQDAAGYLSSATKQDTAVRPSLAAKQEEAGDLPSAARDAFDETDMEQLQKRKTSKIYACVETNPQLDAALNYPYLSRIYLSNAKYGRERLYEELEEDAGALHSKGKEAYYVLPPVFRKDTWEFLRANSTRLMSCGLDGFLLRGMDEIGFYLRYLRELPCVLDDSIYTWSDYTKGILARQGFPWDTIPLELNKKELMHRDNRRSEMIVYGYLPLMVSAQCIRANTGKCDKKPALYYLKDRYEKEFPVKNVCTDCYNVIYNSQPLFLLHLAKELEKLRAAAYRLQFSIESRVQTMRILDCCQTAFFDGQAIDTDFLGNGHTNGHYKRGVE